LRTSVENLVISSLKREGIDFLVYLPEDPSARLTRRISKDPYFTSVRVINENHGVAMAAGASLAGRKVVFVVGTAGLLIATSNLAYAGSVFRIPMLILTSYRGDIGDRTGVNSVYLFGDVCEPLLNTIHIPYKIVTEPARLSAAIHDALLTATKARTPVALLLTEDALW
jgi:sulfopyruvate decarboxylase TPP-binding subunit